MQVVRAALTLKTSPQAWVELAVERRNLARRIWRASAPDGLEFGFDLDRPPLKHGDCIHISATGTAYRIIQLPEPVLVVSLGAEPAAAALLGWRIGNLHCAVELRGGELLVADEPGIRLSLSRQGIATTQATTVFDPHRPPASHAHSA